jgi:MtrB/PioB family decaheme-associated outer membrane protein
MRIAIIAAVSAILISLLVGALPCAAQQEEQPQQSAATWEGSLLFGVQMLAGDRASSKFEEYRDVPSRPWLDVLSIERNDEKKGRYLLFDTTHPGLRDARATLRLGEYGRYGLEIYWDKTPHVLANNGRTIFQQSGSTFTLPDAVQEKLQQIATTDINDTQTGTQIDTAAFGAIINGLLHDTPLRVDRETLAVSYDRQISERSSYSARISNERRAGNMPIGTSFSFPNQVELPMPVDYRTQDVNADYEYRGNRAVVRLGYWGSFFKNENLALRWDNPISAVDASGASSRGQLALPPSNKARTLSLTGAIDLGRDTRLTAALSAARWRQDEALLPMTINSALAAPALPAASADATIKTDLEELVLTSRPAEGVSLTARYRRRSVRNRTPQRVFDASVVADTSLSPEEIETNPFSFRTTEYGLDAGWDIRSGLSFHLGAGRETWNRTHRDVSKTKEDTLRAALDYRPDPKLLARLTLQRSKRDIKGAYVGDEAQLPELRKFDEADRDRDLMGVLLDYTPCERLNATLTLNVSNDGYNNSLFGLRNARHGDVSLDMAYALTETTNLFAGLSFERYRYGMVSRYRPVVSDVVVDDPLNNWSSVSTDKVRTYWVGCNKTVKPGKLDWDFSLSFSDGKGEFDFTGVPGGHANSEPVPWPNVRYKLAVLGGGVNYHVGQDRSLRLGYRFEKYDERDFAIDVMQPYMAGVDPSTATSVFLGASQPDYRAHFFSVSLQQKF